jgi:hypothetical protein
LETIKRSIIAILTVVSGCIFVVSVIAAIVLNSGLLDRYARDQIVALFNDEYYGRLELQEVKLQFPNRVTLRKPAIYEPGAEAPAIEAKKIRMRFNFLMLLQPEIRRLSFRRIAADSLSASIIERKGGKGTIERIFTSRNPDSTRAPLESFFCKNLSLRGAAVTWITESDNAPRLVYRSEKIDLKIKGFRIKENLLGGVLEQGSFNLPSHKFSLAEASGTFHFSPSRSELLAFKARSGRSSAELSVSLDDFNLFGPNGAKAFVERLKMSRSFVHINELKMHTADMRVFYPEFRLPDGLYSIKGKAKVADGSLDILDSRISFGKSRLAFRGEARKIRKSDDLTFRVVCDSSTIEPVFFETFLRETPYAGLAGQLGAVTFFGRAEGSLKQAETTLALMTGIGKVTLDADAKGDLQKQLAWKGSFRLDDLEAYRIIEASGRKIGKNLLQASGTFAARSSGLKRLEQFSLAADIRDSYWVRQEIRSGSISVAYDTKAINTSLLLQNGDELLETKGEIDLNTTVPRYRAEGKMRRINLAKSFASSEYATDLNGTFALKGEGMDARSLNAALLMRFSPSSVNGFFLKEKSELSAAIAQRDGSSRFTLKSDFLDASLSGDYGLKQLAGVLLLAGEGAAREITARSLWKTGIAIPESTSRPDPDQPFRVTYRITVRELAPLALVLPVNGMTLKGSAEGVLLYRNGGCSISSSIDVPLFASAGTTLKEMQATASMECSSKGIPKASAKGKAASLVASGVRASALVFDMAYTPSQCIATFDGDLPDQAWKVGAGVSVKPRGNVYELSVSRFSAGTGGSRWMVPSGSRIVIGSSSLAFDQFGATNGSQRIVLDGELGSSRAGTFRCSLSSIDLGVFVAKAPSGSKAGLDGTVNGTLTVSGAPGAKQSTLSLTGNGIRYDQLTFGSMQLQARHSGGRLGFDFRSSAAPGALSLNAIEGSGSLPLRLQYFPWEVRVPERESVNASFRSDNLSARFIEYLLPFFENAEGVIPATLVISGRTPNPDIYLTARLQDTKVTVEPTQVAYTLNGSVEINPKQVELRDIRIRDANAGTGRLNGVIRLEKLEPKSLALDASCSKLLLFNKKDRKDETSFGTITGSTRRIRLGGEIASPVVEGEMRIDNADFSLYRAGANESAKYTGVDKFIEFVPRNPAETSGEGGKNGAKDRPVEFYYSLLDILQIRDLKLSSVEPLRYTMIFDRLRGEELEASISNLYLIVNKSNQRYRLYGSVNITDGKYRFSNTNFDLEDGGKITWNNAEIRDGRMDNLYGTKYLSITNPQTGERDNVKLLLAITGTLNEPRVGMGYYLNEQMQPYASQSMIGGQPSQIDPNAEINVLSMLLSKQWYAPPGSTGQIGSFAVSSAGLAAGSGLVSSQLSRVVQNIAGVESFNVNLGLDSKGELSGLDLYFALNIPGTNGKLRFVGTGSSPDIKDKGLFSYYGSSQKIEYRVTPKVYVEAYRSYGQLPGQGSNSNLLKPAETWGASISYRERFHTWEQFWKRLVPSEDKPDKKK